MRGPSPWSVADRELMAAFIAKTNKCEFCTKAHSAVAERASSNRGMISAFLSDQDTAFIGEPLRATLLMLGKLTREHTVNADDMRPVLKAGASREQIEDALAVCFSFNVMHAWPTPLDSRSRVLRLFPPARNTCSLADIDEPRLRSFLSGAALRAGTTRYEPPSY
ncbi:carboxymuconolactone decarboxylase family protein [Acidisarcina polymorpha]|uniref:carboxymuconolactone decarboxylase family protein n=1 Tax=Acidisarcina polymorpha TaxID=2211140 RepID=UPI0026A68BB2